MEISSTQYLNSGSDVLSRSEGVASQTLNQEDFLKILTVQLANQDPLNPIQDTEFIGQMTQFTTLEQTRANFNLLLADAVVGKQVTIEISRDDLTGEIKSVEGLVTGIEIKDGSPKVIVNGNAYDVQKVVSYRDSGLSGEPPAAVSTSIGQDIINEALAEAASQY